MTQPRGLRFREFTSERSVEWVAAGFRARDFFPHRSFLLRKAAPDGYKIAVRSGLRPDHAQLWQVVVFARPPATDGLPLELFFDDEILWHRQHYWLPGQVATASLVVKGTRLYTAAHHSDLVQRISRRRELKTQVDARFRGWDRVLLNSILGFATEHGITEVYVPTADAARKETDQARAVQPELFDRVYDRHVRDAYLTQLRDRWWVIDVGANRRRVVLGQARTESRSPTKTIALCHDIERGLGHRQVEPAFVEIADASATTTLETMLAAEADAGISATYNVVGSMMLDVRDQIESGGHSLGFHTFDHYLERRAERARSLLARRLRLGTAPDGQPSASQLGHCRTIDYRIKGYRPARSRLGADTVDAELAYHNFEWLASSSRSLGLDEPRLEHGIVKIPLRYDDFPLHRGMAYEQWEARIAELALEHEFFALSLHDCYGSLWQSRYPSLLRRLGDLGVFKNLDRVAAEVILDDAA
jgi:peptidoglycan/xylan/chitin deacetylase (PgdA/CDA1 family)